MDEQTIRIIKKRDEWRFTVEVKENSKGEPAISVKARDDDNITNAGDLAIKEYCRVRDILKEYHDWDE